MPDKTLIVCVGLPTSGKSRWSSESGFPVVSVDAVTSNFQVLKAPANDSFPGDRVSWALRIARLIVKSLFQMHDTVVVDGHMFGSSKSTSGLTMIGHCNRTFSLRLEKHVSSRSGKPGIQKNLKWAESRHVMSMPASPTAGR